MKSQQSTLDNSHRTKTEIPINTDTEHENNHSLRLSYQNETGNHIVIRLYQNHTDFVREIDIEWAYNYVDNQWNCTNRFTRTYDLDSDGETLAGDGSNWKGTGRNYQDWFTQRHYERLKLRFPADNPPGSPTDHEPAPNPGETTVPAP